MLQIPTTTDIENNLIYAQTIQHGLFPKERHFKKHTQNYFVTYKPQDKIGGDFYWLTSKENIIYFALADCTGHGVSGAMLSVLGISLLNYIIQKNYTDVGDYLTELDKKWIETFNNELNDSHFNNDWLEITLVSYNTITRELQYACGGGEFAICKKGIIEIHSGNSYPIGGWQIETNRKYNTYKLLLDSDAKLYFFSDGIKHQFDRENKKKFSRKRLLNILNSCEKLDFTDQQEIIELALDFWKGTTKQTDDISIIGLQF